MRPHGRGKESRSGLHLFDELDEDATGAAWMDEGDSSAVCTVARLGIDEAHAGRGQFAKRRLQIVDPVREVVQTGPAAFEESGDGRVVGERLEEFETPRALAHKDDLDALIVDPLAWGGGTSGQQTEERKRLVD